MIFDRNEKKQVVALLGAGSMGTAIVRRLLSCTDCATDGALDTTWMCFFAISGSNRAHHCWHNKIIFSCNKDVTFSIFLYLIRKRNCNFAT